MLYSARVECDILLYTRVNADRKWVIIGPSTDTTEKFLFHKGWNILRYMYIFSFSDRYFLFWFMSFVTVGTVAALVLGQS